VERRQAGGRASPVAAPRNGAEVYPGLPAFYFLSSLLRFREAKDGRKREKTPQLSFGAAISTASI